MLIIQTIIIAFANIVLTNFSVVLFTIRFNSITISNRLAVLHIKLNKKRIINFYERYEYGNVMKHDE